MSFPSVTGGGSHELNGWAPAFAGVTNEKTPGLMAGGFCFLRFWRIRRAYFIRTIFLVSTKLPAVNL